MTTEVAFTHLRTWTTSFTRYFSKYIMMYDQVVKICSTNIVMLLVSKKISARYDELKKIYISAAFWLIPAQLYLVLDLLHFSEEILENQLPSAES